MSKRGAWAACALVCFAWRALLCTILLFVFSVGGVAGGRYVSAFSPTRTPVPTITPVSPSSVSVGGSGAYYVSPSQSGGIIPIARGGSTDLSGVGGLRLEKRDLGFCLPGELAQVIGGVPACWSFGVIYVASLRLANVDVTPALGALALAVLLVFVLRQVQER